MFAGFLVMVCWLTVAGCSAAARPDPGQAFDEITRRSLSEDLPYVRARLAPSFVAQVKAEGGNAESDDYVRKLMADLQRCRSFSWQKSDDPSRATVEAACVQPAGILQGKYELIYDKERGWLLAKPAYDLRQMEASKKTP
jgi:hypothetical protein